MLTPWMETIGTLKCTYTAFHWQKEVLYFETHLLVTSNIYMGSLLL